MQLAQREQWDLALDFAQCAKHQADACGRWKRAEKGGRLEDEDPQRGIVFVKNLCN